MAEIKRYFPLEFQLSKQSWDYYELSKGVIPDTEGIKLPNFQIIRLLVNRMVEKKAFRMISNQPIRAGSLNAVGLINEIFRYILNSYRITTNPPAFSNGLNWSREKVKPDTVNTIIDAFVKSFPPFKVKRAKQSAEEYIKSTSDGLHNEQLISKEIILLYMANNNPAFSPFRELFTDAVLSQSTKYADLFRAFEDFFKTQPGFGPNNKPLIDLLKEPINASPYSLTGQLNYIKENWKSIIPEELLYRLLTAVDVLKEEEKLGWLGHGPNLVLRFKGLDEGEYPEYKESIEYERFTKDRDWMAKVVLIAKSVYVWFDQLSKKYGRLISKLDQIPNEELDILNRWGFTGLWIIGIWERSPASRTIKQICGNPEAMSSAYSLYDYTISNDLGGEQAFQNLKDRAWQRGIRLGTDVVPNHTGLYSKWVIEHPDWFIQLDYPPFPSYNFSGPDLSHDPRVGLYIEDGYWTKNDAAVVFKRVDKWTGETKYIYHGNDGTSMPWNDTAQLNFLRADVREAAVQYILAVARRFQIIRLDAAMTLTKKHYQRLWFPHPGTGGGIPSRAEQGMLKSDFDKLMPNEFWRDVVDRVNNEIPDTLLLAEAFWLMEGYFVRTLGMHRVYNSAFMNMLKMEENDKYRSVLKNVLEFNPEILKRFVNFMNNPDEETAVAQFGKGDKYIGVCLMMVTLPGLPMFGHGQIEGFSEKYGMEYKKAYWDEEPDLDLVRRHESEIFPLMRKRHLFSEVENFTLYDFFRTDGTVNENVFAYSNICGNERALVVYNNKYENTNGWIRTSCSISVKAGTHGERKLIQKTLAEGLSINTDGSCYYIFKDQKSGLEYIRHGREIMEKGIYVELGAYHYHVFTDFREVRDVHADYYYRLMVFLNGRGVPNIEESLKEMILAPIHTPFKYLVGKEVLQQMIGAKFEADSYKLKLEEFISATKNFIKSECDISNVSRDTMDKIGAVIKLKNIKSIFAGIKVNNMQGIDYLTMPMKDALNYWNVLIIWSIVQNIGKIRTENEYESQSVALIDELLLGRIISESIREYEHDEWSAAQKTNLIKILAGYHNWYSVGRKELIFGTFKKMLNDYDVQLYLNFNYHNGILWYSKERIEDLLYWLLNVSVVSLISSTGDNKKILEGINQRHQVIMELIQASVVSGYKVQEIIKSLS